MKIITIPSFQDDRGVLSAVEQHIDIPFNIRRIFYIHHIKANRGDHALVATDEMLIPVSGSFSIKLYDRNSSKVFLLDDPIKGLYVPRLIFLEMRDFSKDAVCLVLANTTFKTTRYLRTKAEFYAYLDKHKKRRLLT